MLKVFDCFAGYGGAEFALKKANIEHECVGFSEIDKYAIQCFQQNHGKIKNYGNISIIDWKEVPNFDLLTGGFPCQDVSQAGKQDLSKGRSILVNELIRCLKEKQPKYFLFENVGAIETQPFKEFLRGIENDLKRCGYVVFRKSMNSKDYGIPQNRERVWWIGYRKNVYTKEFGWTPYPQPQELKISLKDILEETVDKKYFLKQEQVAKIFSNKVYQGDKLNNVNGVCGCIPAHGGNNLKGVGIELKELTSGVSDGQRIYDSEGCAKTIKGLGGEQGAKTGLYLVGNKNPSGKGQSGNIYSTAGVSPTICAGGNNPTRKRDVGYSNGLYLINEKTRDVNKAIETATKLSKETGQPIQLDLYHLKHGELRPLSTYIPQHFGVSRCLQAGEPKEIMTMYRHSFENFKGYKNVSVPIKSSEGSGNQVLCYTDKSVVRRLTPKECFRLMGFLNDEINLDELSDTQKYKLAGNGWDINLVSKIFKTMQITEVQP